MPREVKDTDKFQKKLLKLLPSEAVVTYLAVVNIIPQQQDTSRYIYWIIIGVIFIATPFYLVKFMEKEFKTHKLQITITALSFIIWAFSINGEVWLNLPESYYFLKTLILVVWTFLFPLFIARPAN